MKQPFHSFPSSAWERSFAKLRFARHQAELGGRFVAKQSLGTSLLGTFLIIASTGLIAPIESLNAQEPKQGPETKKDEKSPPDLLPPGAIRRLGAVPDKYGAKSGIGHTGGVYDLAF